MENTENDNEKLNVEINNVDNNNIISNVNKDESIKKIDTKNKKKNSVGKEIFEWLMVIVVALLISMVIKAFIFSTYKVQQVSMENTLIEGHNVIVYKTGYFFNNPKHGDIIVFMHEEGQFKNLFKYLPVKNPGEVDYIKRVIGLPGDQIDIRDGSVYRKSVGDTDFNQLVEPYIKGITASKGMQLPFTVPEDKLFVMGDNREQSTDSREIGPIDIAAVIGQAKLRIWPLSRFGTLN
jgi:signal peptidase I